MNLNLIDYKGLFIIDQGVGEWIEYIKYKNILNVMKYFLNDHYLTFFFEMSKKINEIK